LFIGEYQHTLDNKFRVILPIKLRQSSQEKPIKIFMMTLGLNQCIDVYTLERWDNLNENEWKNIPRTDPSGIAYLRLVYANATESEPDRQGRIFIPMSLRKHAQIQKEIIINGAGDHIEIWSQQKWEEYVTKEQQSFVDHASKLTIYGRTK